MFHLSTSSGVGVPARECSAPHPESKQDPTHPPPPRIEFTRLRTKSTEIGTPLFGGYTHRTSICEPVAPHPESKPDPTHPPLPRIEFTGPRTKSTEIGTLLFGG